jgi:hypothetical protein
MESLCKHVMMVSNLIPSPSTMVAASIIADNSSKALGCHVMATKWPSISIQLPTSISWDFSRGLDAKYCGVHTIVIKTRPF